MKTLKFYGTSDDLFEIEGDIQEEIGCYDSPVACLLESASDGGKMYVTAQYAHGHIGSASWSIGIMNASEDVHIPEWPMRYETAENEYSPLLVIECPDDVTFKMVCPKFEED